MIERAVLEWGSHARSPPRDGPTRRASPSLSRIRPSLGEPAAHRPPARDADDLAVAVWLRERGEGRG